LFTDPPQLTWSRTRSVEFTGSALPGLAARFAHVDGNLVMRECRITGKADLMGAHIDGQLDLRGARLSNPADVAVHGDGLAVGAGVSCGQGFSAEGEIRLVGARLGGSLEMNGAQLTNPGGRVLSADRVTVGASVLCCDGFTARGEIGLPGARVAGDVDLSDAALLNEDGPVLEAAHLDVGGSMFCRRTTARGQIKLFAAHVGGVLSFVDAHLSNPGGCSVLSEDGLIIGGSALFNKVVATGEICMLRANIGGLLSFMDAQLTNAGATVLTLDGLTVDAGVHCGGSFTAIGRIRLAARIGGWLNLNGAQLTNPSGDALACAGASMQLLRFHTREPVTGAIDLSHAHIERIDDDLSCWPDHLQLDGLTYQTLAAPGRPSDRLSWLGKDRSRPHLSQPYEQLAATYRRLGDDHAARTILLVKHRRQRATLRWHGKLWGYLQDITVGYGFRPTRAAVWLLALLTAGTIAYGLHHPPPVQADTAPGFNPLIYTLDLLLPVIDFGQEHAFRPTGPWQWLAYALIASGWILATTIAAGITRTVTRQ
jgi:hypothetical protein